MNRRYPKPCRKCGYLQCPDRELTRLDWCILAGGRVVVGLLVRVAKLTHRATRWIHANA